MLPLKATMQTESEIESYKIMTFWKMGGVVQSPIIGRCFVALLVLEFENELGVCPKQDTKTICC
jgi:hypothetical protein